MINYNLMEFVILFSISEMHFRVQTNQVLVNSEHSEKSSPGSSACNIIISLLSLFLLLLLTFLCLAS